MNSTTVSVIAAVCFISFVSGHALDREVANNAAIKCAGSGWSSRVSTVQSKKAPKTGDEIMKLACTAPKEFVQCIIDTDPADYKSPVPDMLHFILAYEWQLMIITTRAGLCKDMPIDELRKITMATGIMKKQNLPNVEKDSYKKCVGDAVRRCIIRVESLLKTKMDNDLLASMLHFVGCIEEADKTCDAIMLDHFIAFLKAYQKHLEENKGKFAKMAENIQSN